MTTAGRAGARPAAPETRRAERALLVLAGLVLVLRLASLGSYPLMDTSEARYGEIARLMLVTGNYVTPQEMPGTPFWAKPPLYAWMSMAAIRALGVNEFALRLPSFICALIVLALVWSWASSLASPRTAAQARVVAAIAVALLSTAALFAVSAGAVMTDPSLAACTTAMLVAFHHAAIRGSRSPLWRYGFFVATGLAMLAKGPVLVLYVGAPIVLWALWQRRVAGTWAALPWLRGTLLAALICVPWYVMAEIRTPGFLRYFLLGEHVMRFLRPGWGGDLYGNAHAEPLGTIWLYLIEGLGVSALLALAVGAAALRARLRPTGGAAGGPVLPTSDVAERRFLLLAVFFPVAVFTFAGNIIWTYNLPVLGPLAVLLADQLAPRVSADLRWRAATLASVSAAAVALAVAVIWFAPRHVAQHTAAALVARWRAETPAAPGTLFYLGRKAPASLRFYSRGEVTATPDPAQVVACLGRAPDCYLMLPPALVGQIQPRLAAFPQVATVESLGANKDLELLRVHARAAPARPPGPGR